MTTKPFKYTDPDDLKTRRIVSLDELDKAVTGLEDAVSRLAIRVATLEAWAQDHDPGPTPGEHVDQQGE